MVILHCATQTPNFLLCSLFSHNKRSAAVRFAAVYSPQQKRSARLQECSPHSHCNWLGSSQSAAVLVHRKTFAENLVWLVINRRRGRERNGKVGLENGKICSLCCFGDDWQLSQEVILVCSRKFLFKMLSCGLFGRWSQQSKFNGNYPQFHRPSIMHSARSNWKEKVQHLDQTDEVT